MKNKNILLSREVLLERVWKDSLNKQAKTVNVAIKRLNQLLIFNRMGWGKKASSSKSDSGHKNFAPLITIQATA